jgi:hypothetical protein
MKSILVLFVFSMLLPLAWTHANAIDMRDLSLTPS